MKTNTNNLNFFSGLDEHLGHLPHKSRAALQNPVVFVGLAVIAKAVGAGPMTIRKWIQEENFPARRYTDGIYRADPEAVRRWFNEQHSNTKTKA